jgi:hypothetical protein
MQNSGPAGKLYPSVQRCEAAGCARQSGSSALRAAGSGS